MDQRIPAAARPLLADYLRALEHDLPGLAGGVYVFGSIALGAFNDRFSDIDLVAVLRRRAGADDCRALAALHQRLRQAHPRPDLTCSYLQAGDLGRDEQAIEPHPAFHDKTFHERDRYELNSVTWWLLKHRGIALAGPPPADLPFDVDWDTLIARMRENLNGYWGRWARSPVRAAYLFGDGAVQWAVLGVLRQFYSFRENAIISKTGAGHYALEHLPARWHRIVSEAIALREGGERSHYRSRLRRAIDARALLRHVIKTVNDAAQRLG